LIPPEDGRSEESIMKKIGCLLTLLLLASFALDSNAQVRPRRVGSANQQPPSAPSKDKKAGEEVGEDDVVRINTTLVTIPVSVMDRDGKYIPDLRKEDFRIYENGVEQEIAYFATVEKPFTVALVLDTSRSTRFRMEEIQEAAIAFVDQLRPDDRVMVVSFDESVRVLCEPTSDRRTLREAIMRARTGGGTRLYDAVDFVLNHRFDKIQGRKAIVLFTDGVDTMSRQASYESTLRDAEEADALIYPIQYDTYEDVSGWPFPRRRPSIILGWPFPIPAPWPDPGGAGTGTSRAEYERGTRYLTELAQRTGARKYNADTTRSLDQAFALIAEELRRQYSLGYYPKNPPHEGERRRIAVRVNRPNTVVRARDSYIYTSANDTQQTDNQQPGKPELKRRFIVNAKPTPAP
jgi:VWFA-related protein